LQPELIRRRSYMSKVAAGDLYRHRFVDVIGTDRIFNTLCEALA
jgi:alpha-D-ribose 1-methylphosphonate 5-triphosphate diphosphatase PhnM